MSRLKKDRNKILGEREEVAEVGTGNAQRQQTKDYRYRIQERTKYTATFVKENGSQLSVPDYFLVRFCGFEDKGIIINV